MGREFESRPAPAELDVGMLELRLGHERGPRHEPECVPEVLELERPAELLISFALPVGDLRREPPRLLFAERGRPLLAGLAMLGGQRHEAGATGLEPAASGVTGRRSNQSELRPREQPL